MLHELLHCVVKVVPLPLHTSQRVIRTFFLHFGQYRSSVAIGALPSKRWDHSLDLFDALTKEPDALVSSHPILESQHHQYGSILEEGFLMEP